MNSSNNLNAIAIIGMSCRFPSANSTNEYWQILSQGLDCVIPIPAGRPIVTYAGDERYNRGKEVYAGFLKIPIDEFDAKFFGISPREAPFVDPQQRLLLEVTWEALEDAGINAHSLMESEAGVFAGISSQDYDRMLPSTKLTGNEMHHKYIGNAFSATAARISFFLGLNGPNVVLESGCSSSLSAVHFACSSLLKNETTLAIASGVNLILNPHGGPYGGGITDSVVLSMTHRCRSFDAAADGFVRAEGCGVIILKRYSDAIRDTDNIQGIILGSALNNDGAGNSFGTPNGKAQERVIRKALANAGLAANRISYVEAHGTGTVTGDPTELKAIGNVYSENRSKPLLIGSVKSNIGHAESAAGIAGLIKIILSLKHGAVPPNLNLTTLNPKIDLDGIPAIIPLAITDWVEPGRIAAVSSFGMSGTNVHVLIQEPIRKHPQVEGILVTANNTKSHLLQLSAKSPEALQALILSYIDFIKSTSETTSCESIAFGTNCRAKFSYRISVLFKTKDELISKLEQKALQKIPGVSMKPKIAFLFTGQGSQYVGMATNLYQEFPVFQKAVNHCNKAFKNKLGQSLLTVISNPELLESTRYCQPALFCIQYSLLLLWNSFGVNPDFVLGHSVGEFAAAVAAGFYSFQDAFLLVTERSRLVATIPPGSMLVLTACVTEVENTKQKFVQGDNWVDVAAINSTEEVVVSGKACTIKSFKLFCDKLNIKNKLIPTNSAFHSKAIDGILEQFESFVSKVRVNKPLKAGYISGTLGLQISDGGLTPLYWKHQLRNPVQFGLAVRNLWNEGVRCFVEIGSQPTLLGLTMANIGTEISSAILCPSIRKNEEDRTCILGSCSKLFDADIDIDLSRGFGSQSKEICSQLPMYPFHRQKYWYADTELNSRAEGLQLANFDPSVPIHPLLGQKLEIAVSQTVFCSKIDTSRPNLNYLLDHCVATKIILPAAAYLEIMMAAEIEVLHMRGHKHPIVVENFSVEALLQLDLPPLIQVIVNSVNANYSTEIYKYGQGQRWKRHVSGIVRPLTGIEIKIPHAINLEELKSSMNPTPPEKLFFAYASISKRGIQFGPKFQSIRAAWKENNENNSASVMTEIFVPIDTADYVCHPVLLDAMIQTFGFRDIWLDTQEYGTVPLRLAVGIGKFSWLAQNEVTELLYARTTFGNGKVGDGVAGGGEHADGTVWLYNSHGLPLACMEGIQLISTNEHSFLRGLRAVDEDLPDFMTEIWKPSPGSNENQILLPIDDIDSNTWTNLADTLETIRTYENTGWLGEKKMNTVALLALVRSIVECKWDLHLNEIINLDNIRKQLPGPLQQTKFLEYCVHRLQTEGYIENVYEELSLVKSFPSLKEATAMIKCLFEEAIEICGQDGTILFAERVTKHMTEVLQGNMTALELFFPKSTNLYGAEKFYSGGSVNIFTSKLATSCLLDTLSSIRFTAPTQKVQILEVGGGTGGMSAFLLQELTKLKIPFDYTFTDISPYFLTLARQKFAEYKNITFEVLNIEEDPLTQNFPPEVFDYIVGFQVVHATKNLTETLLNLNTLLRHNGKLFLTEQFIDMDLICHSFGLLEGWWRFEDERELSPVCNVETWKNLFLKTGYDHPETIEILDKSQGAIWVQKSKHACMESPVLPTWIVIDDLSPLSQKIQDKFKKQNRKTVRSLLNTELISNEFKKILSKVDCNSPIEGIIFLYTQEEQDSIFVTQERICKTLIHIWQAIVNMEEKPRFYAITCGTHSIGPEGIPTIPNAATIWGTLRSFSNEHPEVFSVIIDSDPISDSNLEATRIFAEFWNARKKQEMLLAFRSGKRYAQRIVPYIRPSSQLELPCVPNYAFLNPVSKLFSDIQFVPVEKPQITNTNQVVIAVRATALNFRDLLVVLRPEGFELPKGHPMEVGLDIAGTVVSKGAAVKQFEVGDEVLSVTFHGGLASHVTVPEAFLMKKPSGMTFASACTIPCGFLTAYHSLVDVARISVTDHVLIHVASGGVGLAAIQIAQHAGATIYATAGSHRKRAYLKHIGVINVFNSRTLEFGEKILSLGDGNPRITIVLNSLTSPGFKETSLRTCAPGAHFVEIGKMQIWQPEEVQILRPDVKYSIVDLSDMALSYPSQVEEIVKALTRKFETGSFRPLPHSKFPLNLIREAFQFFQDAKHIGKVVVQMPVLDTILNERNRMTFRHNLFDPQGTYIITGGLGGIGMEVAHWMKNSGTVHIVLVGRNKPNDDAQNLINSWNDEGSHIVAMQVDVSDFEACSKFILEIRRSLPQIRGIFHAAGLLRDDILPNQSWEKFHYALAPKAFGAWNLHQLTQRDDLDYFVLFSSIAAMFGMVGQSNHSAGNRYLDALAHHRISLGLPASSINWGVWSDVGLAAQMKIGQEGAYGVAPFTPKQGIASLEYILTHQVKQMTVIYVSDWNVIRRVMPLGNYYADVADENFGNVNANVFDELVESIKAASAEDRRERVETYLEELLKDTLKLPSKDKIGRDQIFATLGVDSLMTMELRNRLQGLLGEKNLSLASMQENRTVATLGNHLTNLINS